MESRPKIESFTGPYTNCHITYTGYWIPGEDMKLESFDDKPSYIKEWDSTGTIEHRWHKNNVCHRTTGPARIEYLNNHCRVIVNKAYWINGKQITAEEFVTQYFITHLKEYDGI